jgi:anti-anti-sigma regulatory factor
MPSSERERIGIDRHEDLVVLRPAGYLNGQTGRALDVACQRLSDEGCSRIVIDFGRIDAINTTGILGLFSLLENAGHARGSVCFSNLSGLHREQIDALDLSQAVLIFDDTNAAQNYLQHR